MQRPERGRPCPYMLRAPIASAQRRRKGRPRARDAATPLVCASASARGATVLVVTQNLHALRTARRTLSMPVPQRGRARMRLAQVRRARERVLMDAWKHAIAQAPVGGIEGAVSRGQAELRARARDADGPVREKGTTIRERHVGAAGCGSSACSASSSPGDSVHVKRVRGDAGPGPRRSPTRPPIVNYRGARGATPRSRRARSPTAGACATHAGTKHARRAAGARARRPGRRAAQPSSQGATSQRVATE